MKWIEVKVDAYSGSRGEEEPRRVFVDGAWHEIAGIIDQWREPGARRWCAVDAEGDRWELRCRDNDSEWERWVPGTPVRS